jgi:hypothetical protein
VAYAINRGDMKRAHEHLCSDCGRQARDWDHRDYLRPLAVEAVCRTCNQRRGVAFDSVMRPPDEASKPAPYVHIDRRTTRRAQTPPLPP